MARHDTAPSASGAYGRVGPLSTRTLATEFWARSAEFDQVGAAPFALAMILLSLPLCAILYRQARGAIGQ